MNYDNVIIAVDAAAAGNEIVNVPLVDVLSDPKSNTAIALLLLVELYISAPLAENVVLVKDISAKSIIAVPLVAVSPPREIVTPVSVPPPGAYPPLEATSLLVEYTDVPADNEAKLVNKAIFKVSVLI
tara:strand:+ start:1490 stop:1873 length:384 start_codon:yes stop_codon:yes gene_type:complete